MAMAIKLTRRACLLGAAALLSISVLAQSLAHAGDEKLKIGFVYVSPIGDAGWTFQHDLGRKAIEAKFGDKVATTFVESVAEGADAERVIRQLAASGNQLIFTTSFGYMNPTQKVARQFPNVRFEHATGFKRAKNVATYVARFYEGRYLAGIAAGKKSQSGIAGYVAAFPIPEVVRGINAFTRGFRSVRPDAEVRVIWTSSWYDPGKEREAAEALANQGADVLTHHTDSTAIVQTAEDRKINAIGYHSDMSKYGPNAHLTASVHNWTEYYVSRVKAAIDGTWSSGDVWGGIGKGMVDLADFGPGVDEATKTLIKETKGKIADGSLHPFAGPVKDNTGKEVVPAGNNMSDEALQKMNYYVEGVVGKVPQ